MKPKQVENILYTICQSSSMFLKSTAIVVLPGGRFHRRITAAEQAFVKYTTFFFARFLDIWMALPDPSECDSFGPSRAIPLYGHAIPCVRANHACPSFQIPGCRIVNEFSVLCEAGAMAGTVPSALVWVPL